MVDSSLAAVAVAATGSTSPTRGLEPIPSALLNVGDEIGKGRFKRVHRGRHKKRDVVILRYSKDTDCNELRILTLLARRENGKHYVPLIYGVCQERDATSVVQELAPWGALKGALKSDTAPEITIAHKLCIAEQLAQAMIFLQSLRVVHADLSCRNVLMFQLDEDPCNCLVKVTDFGLSVILEDDVDSVCVKQPQATRWCSPETIADLVLSHQSDVWSLGATYWEIFANGVAPWVKREKRADVASRLREIAWDKSEVNISVEFPAPDGCPPLAHRIILRCLKANPDERPSFAELVDVLRKQPGADSPRDAIPDPEVPQNFNLPAADNGPIKQEDPPDVKAVPARGTTPTPSTAAPNSREATPMWLEGEAPETGQGNLYRQNTCLWSPSSDGPSGGSIGGRFGLLRAYLSSQHALSSLGDETVQAMWKELDDAQSQETHLWNLVRRLQRASQQGGAQSASVQRRSVEKLEVVPNTMLRDRGFGSASCEELRLPRRSAPLQNNGTLFSPLPSVQSRAASSERLPERPPRSSSAGPPDNNVVPLPPHAGLWTLWSFDGPVLRRQDFANGASAWAAFEVDKSKPCMLRDPNGGEAAARSWVASYFKMTSETMGPPGSGPGPFNGVQAPGLLHYPPSPSSPFSSTSKLTGVQAGGANHRAASLSPMRRAAHIYAAPGWY